MSEKQVGRGAPFRGSRARAAGQVTRGRLRGSGYRRLARDTYVAGEVEVDERVRVVASALSAGPTAVVTGWSACVLLGLDVAPRSMPVELSVLGRRLKRRDMIVRRQRFADDEVVEEGGVRCTTPLRTAYDIATRTALVDAVVAADALGRLGRFTGADLAAFAGRHRGERGCRRVLRVAALMDPRPDSPTETRTRLLLVLAGLPAPRVRYEVRDEHRVAAEVDLAWPEYRVAVEYDGRDHAAADRRGRDIDRVDELEQLGWVVITITARQLYRRPARTVERVREALLARGWVPSPR